jgi:hypothetical protein
MIDTAATPKFPMGQIVATPMALEVIKEGNQTPDHFLWRHLHGDWGTLCDDDKQANDDALESGARIFSAYETHLGERLWVITEAADQTGYRLATTILLPSEY